MTSAGAPPDVSVSAVGRTVLVALLMGLSIAGVGTLSWVALFRLNVRERPDVPWAAVATGDCAGRHAGVARRPGLAAPDVDVSAVPPAPLASATRRLVRRQPDDDPGPDRRDGRAHGDLRADRHQPPARGPERLSDDRHPRLGADHGPAGCRRRRGDGVSRLHAEPPGARWADVRDRGDQRGLHPAPCQPRLRLSARHGAGFLPRVGDLRPLAQKSGSILPGMAIHFAGDLAFSYFGLLGGDAARLFVDPVAGR